MKFPGGGFVLILKFTMDELQQRETCRRNAWTVMMKTFENSTAERIPAIYFFGFTKLSATMSVVQRLVLEL